MRKRLSILSSFPAHLFAFFCFAIECHGNARGSTHFAQRQNFDFEVTAGSFDVQAIANLHIARRLRKLAVRLDPPKFTRGCGNGPGLEKSGRPQVLIDSQDYNITRLRGEVYDIKYLTACEHGG